MPVSAKSFLEGCELEFSEEEERKLASLQDLIDEKLNTLSNDSKIRESIERGDHLPIQITLSKPMYKFSTEEKTKAALIKSYEAEKWKLQISHKPLLDSRGEENVPTIELSFWIQMKSQ